MIINEVVSTVADWQWIDYSKTTEVVRNKLRGDKKTVPTKMAVFQVGDEEFVVKFVRVSLPGIKEYRVEFDTVSNNRAQNPYHLTGKGSAGTIFATVIEIIQAFVNQTNPHTIGFAAKEPNRIKLYHRMIKRFAPGKRIREYISRGYRIFEIELRPAKF